MHLGDQSSHSQTEFTVSKLRDSCPGNPVWDLCRAESGWNAGQTLHPSTTRIVVRFCVQFGIYRRMYNSTVFLLAYHFSLRPGFHLKFGIGVNDSNNTMTSQSVWIQLYLGTEKSGSVFELRQILNNVNDLKEEVKKRRSNTLRHVDDTGLKVYRAGTPVPVPKGTDPLEPWKPVPTNTTGPAHLIVIAPVQVEQQPQQGK